MGELYTPRLTVAERMEIRKERRLPLKGEVIVSAGVRVNPDTVVAKTFLPGQVELVNVANALGIDPKEVRKVLQKKEGDRVGEGELLAMTSGLFGLFKSECRSPISGAFEIFSEATGGITLRKSPIPVELKAFIEGDVQSIIPAEGVILQSWGSYIQGIFGIGGETSGPLYLGVSSKDEELNNLDKDFSGGIVVGGSYVSLSVLKEAVEFGIKGIITGGIDDQDLKGFLGYDLGVAITGREEKNFTLIVTEGFGKISMAAQTFEILKKAIGRPASIHGRTQIRAGVIRPEIMIPFMEEEPLKRERTIEKESPKGLAVGSTVRIIREPYFGQIGEVSKLPAELHPLETESKTRVVEVILGEKKVIVPRANVELL